MSSDTQPLTGIDLDVAADLAAQLRVDSIRASTSAGSGHPTSSMSAADLLPALVGRHLRYDWDNCTRTPTITEPPQGRCVPAAVLRFKAVGVVSDEQLITGHRRFGPRRKATPPRSRRGFTWPPDRSAKGCPRGGDRAGGPVPRPAALPGVGAVRGQRDGGRAPSGEALDKAAYYRLSNLTAIVDVNRLGQRGPTEYQWDLAAYNQRAEAFGVQRSSSTVRPQRHHPGVPLHRGRRL